ncbi:MAG: type II CAAX prenyl endopeptidase Rce1 family protein [Myxococcota bacterium]
MFPLEGEPAPERRNVPPLLFSVALACVAMALFIGVGATTQVLNVGFGLWFTEVFIFFAVPWVALRLTGRSPPRHTGLSYPGLAPLGFGFLLGTVNYFAWVVPLQFVSHLLAPEWMKELFDAAQIFKNQTPLELLVIITGVGLAAPVCEEVFFRGTFQQGLMSRLPAPWALVVTAAVFSAFHLDPVGFFARFELGVLFGVLFWKSGSVWPGIAAHAANNLVSTALYFALAGAGVEEEEPAPLAVATLALVGLSAMAAVVQVGRRWKAAWRVPTPAMDVPGQLPLAKPLRLVVPWLAAAGVSLLLLFTVDWRGVQLNLWDVRHRLPPMKKDATLEEKANRKALDELRSKARRGEVSLEEYQRRRKALAEQL